MKRNALVAAMMLFTSMAFAQVPGTLSYQGILVNGSGAPVADGNHTVVFNFYTTAAGGVPVFARGQFTVTTYKGMFTLVLGTGVPDNTINGPLPVLSTDPNYIGGSQYYIELVADNVILAPRVQLSSVPYAFNAQNANSMSAAGLTGAANLPNSVLDTDLQDLADGSLSGTKVDGATITAINAGNITSGTLPAARIGAGAIDNSQLATDAVTTGKVLDGTITNADISGSAAIAGSKISPSFGATTVTGLTIGTSVWPANSTGVLTNNGTGTLSWSAAGSNNIDGLTDAAVTSPASGQVLVYNGTSDFQNRSLSGDIASVTGSGVVTLANSSTTRSNLGLGSVSTLSTITSAEITDLTIVNADINASAAIADGKLATISTAGKVANSATTATNANTASTIVARDASGNFSAGTITAALSGNASTATTVTTNANLTGDVTSVGNATSIASGVIVDGDINASGITTAGKVSGGAITSGTIGGSTAISTTGNIATTGTGTLTVAGTSTLKGAIGLGAVPDYGTAGKVLTSQGSGTAAIWSTPATTGWGLTGNASTVDGTSFIGTTDNIPLNIRVNNQKAGRIDPTLFNEFYGYTAGNSITTGFANAGFGNSALLSTTTGDNNVAIGASALTANTTGQHNVAVGVGALASNTTAIDNSAVGLHSMQFNTVGSKNSAYGIGSLQSNVAGGGATAIGNGAMQNSNNTATPFTNGNVAVGYEALKGSATASANTGNFNAALGYQSLSSNTTGNSNIAIGYQTLYLNTTGAENTATGVNALALNSTGLNNTATGKGALLNNTTGTNNTANGWLALSSNVAGSNATAIGTSAMLYANSSATFFTNTNVAVGYEALRGSTTASANTGNSNTALGYQTLSNNTIGYFNTASGNAALYQNTTGNANSAYGMNTLVANTSGSNNSGFGNGALYANTTGGYNSANGVQSLYTNTIGSYNVAIGFNSLNGNVAGSNGTAFGTNAMQYSNSQAGAFTNSNVAVGYEALRGSTSASANTGNNNTALGYAALWSNMTGFENTAVGFESLYTNNTGSSNVASGFRSLYNNTSGIWNVANGHYSLYSNTTGAGNTAIGLEAGYTATPANANTTGNYNTFIGYKSGPGTSTQLTNTTAIGYKATVATSNSLVLGGTGADAVNVGVGITSPVSTMHLDKSGVGNVLRFSESGTLRGAVGISGASNDIINGDVDNDLSIRAEGNMVFGIAASEKMRISSATGSVGIGTSSPDRKLDIEGTGLIAARITSTDNSGAAVEMIRPGSGNSDFRIINNATLRFQYGGATDDFFTAVTDLMTVSTTGNVSITGSLSKGSGSFKIDHPLDPANKYLYHSFVESPDMMNVYNGNVVTDGNGLVTVVLPDYFEALNKDFRYQLTVIKDFAQAIIFEEVSNNKFVIKTDKPNIKVSWQVTGIRKDPFAEQNRIPNEEMKAPADRGHYLHPAAYGQPANLQVNSETGKN